MFDLQTTSSLPTSSFQALERRGWIRFTCDLDATCLPSAEDPEVLWPARVLNLSCGGVGLLVSRRFEPDTLLQIELQTAKRSFSRPLLVQVLHVTGHQTGGWLIGCSFPQPLSEEELHQLM